MNNKMHWIQNVNGIKLTHAPQHHNKIDICGCRLANTPGILNTSYVVDMASSACCLSFSLPLYLNGFDVNCNATPVPQTNINVKQTLLG